MRKLHAKLAVWYMDRAILLGLAGHHASSRRMAKKSWDHAAKADIITKEGR